MRRVERVIVVVVGGGGGPAAVSVVVEAAEPVGSDLIMKIGASPPVLIGGVVVIVRNFRNAGSPICNGLIKYFVVVFVENAFGFVVMDDEDVKIRREVPSIVMNVQKMSVC